MSYVRAFSRSHVRLTFSIHPSRKSTLQHSDFISFETEETQRFTCLRGKEYNPSGAEEAQKQHSEIEHCPLNVLSLVQSQLLNNRNLWSCVLLDNIKVLLQSKNLPCSWNFWIAIFCCSILTIILIQCIMFDNVNQYNFLVSVLPILHCTFLNGTFNYETGMRRVWFS